MTAIDYAVLLARIVRASNRIKALLLPRYGEKFTVGVGTEQDRVDFQRSAPYALFFPMDEDASPERTSYTVRMEIGICDEALSELGGVPVISCYEYFSSLVPLSLRQIAEQLPGMVEETVHLQNYRAVYDQEAFPLVKAIVDIEITELTPVGRRSVI